MVIRPEGCYSQPPLKPARFKPARTQGMLRVKRHSRPERKFSIIRTMIP
jgi:hypothetical protein